jgi:hypothetical protein
VISRAADDWRSVIALPAGRKWITILEWTTIEAARVPLDLWQRLHPRPASGYSARRVRAAIKARLRSVKKTQASATLPLRSSDGRRCRAAVARIAALGW